MRFSSIIVGGLIATGLLMAVMPKAFAGNPPERPGPAAVRTGRMTLQQISQIPQPRVPHRTIYSSRPELR